MDTSTRAARDVDRMLRRELVVSLATPVGGLVTLGIGIALVPLRTHLGVPAVVSIFAIVIIAATLVGTPGAGLTCAAIAALSSDFFLRAPYGTLHTGRPAFWRAMAAYLSLAALVGLRVRR